MTEMNNEKNLLTLAQSLRFAEEDFDEKGNIKASISFSFFKTLSGNTNSAKTGVYILAKDNNKIVEIIFFITIIFLNLMLKYNFY